ncbi:hypothetical protein ABAC460_00865 [Asticcacaulis sp. AC460]|nr:hypothetical protein ABAC460_00865 [Asticcacaulis sp. AC460]
MEIASDTMVLNEDEAAKSVAHSAPEPGHRRI